MKSGTVCRIVPDSRAENNGSYLELSMEHIAID